VLFDFLFLYPVTRGRFSSEMKREHKVHILLRGNIKLSSRRLLHLLGGGSKKKKSPRESRERLGGWDAERKYTIRKWKMKNYVWRCK
jgi:hypothetical protein